MTPLIAMPGPVLPETGYAAGDAHAWPPMPALDGLLHAARRLPGHAHWRQGVMAALFPGDKPVEAVALAARALPSLPAGSGVCFATPLHVVAGISRVHLPPGGRLQLDAAAREAWREAFNREFGSTQIALHAAGNGWLLQAPFAPAAVDPDPADLAGQALAREASREPAARALRRLGAEVEMWLADHPLNHEAQQRQLPPLNCLWFWGGGQSASLPEPGWRPRLVASALPADGWTAGLAAHLGATLVEDAAAWNAQWPESLLLLAPHDVADAAWWQQAEARWLAPAREALRAGKIRNLRLQIGASAWQVPPRAPWRWPRRRRAWHALVNP